MNEIIGYVIISGGIGFLAGLSVAIVAIDFGRNLKNLEDIDNPNNH